MTQFNALVYAQMQGELNSQDAHDRRKQEIQRTNERNDEETQTRQDADSAIREELSQKRQIRDQQDEGLQHQADSNAEANIRTVLTVQDLNARRKADLTREEQARIANYTDLQGQIDNTPQKQPSKIL